MAHLVGIVIGKDPGKDGVLRQVVVGPAGDGVQADEVLEVGDVSVDPLLRQP